MLSFEFSLASKENTFQITL